MSLIKNDNFCNFAEPSDIIADAASGKMFILLDDEDRENEGDLIVLASEVTSEHVNFMLKFGRGLMCLAVAGIYAEKLKLTKIPTRNVGSDYTAFLTPIDLKSGISTGVSTEDRAKTVRAVVDNSSVADDFITPGHILPILAVEGGVLSRRGHTEASVDVALLAKLPPAAVICEVMNDDGSMARRDDLVRFGEEHGIKVSTISKLIEYIQEKK